MAGCEIWLIRHGESDWNAAGRWQGHGNPGLSAHGREQAAARALRLAGEGFDALYASDLQRALETAAAIGVRIGLEAVVDPRLRERDVGRWTGLRAAEIRRTEAALLLRFERRDDPDLRPGGGESDNDLARRVRPCLAELGAAHPGQKIACVTHLGVVRLFAPQSAPDFASVTVIKG